MQGNAGTPLGRIPLFRRLLLGIRLTPKAAPPSDAMSDTAILAVAPRSFWKSTPRRPTERGIMSDYEQALAYACKRFPSSNIVIYGHSLGGAAAVCLVSRLRDTDKYRNVKGFVLENPFASIPAMVKAVYPQRWLPYHYLGGCALDKWDAVGAMARAQVDSSSLLHRLSRSMLLILSEKDEIVPTEHGQAIFEATTRGAEEVKEGEQRRLVIIPGALHETTWRERRWRAEVEAYIRSVNQGPTMQRTGNTVVITPDS
ncbi:uncharacterized protein PHACADRAFT_262514 [Phanerochaete carnosa HHB-10118-sp]|uniref:Serine aminopeptidase S33 domain-containing protein n=1 Tax=Phanerochaete carnosa (strain HHB-10118-sp) TaxID=650164 RepID=K5VZL9_PHACS|nr:uncharacterized protein PHACADRAFT_262514 [Phanerochaete carnosa HHB-10118-sp]EKM52064.1 hypothetical protein PHACADRAFT_262514 [Phanerochaete carnosa HHB-10118-sp]